MITACNELQIEAHRTPRIHLSVAHPTARLSKKDTSLGRRNVRMVIL